MDSFVKPPVRLNTLSESDFESGSFQETRTVNIVQWAYIYSLYFVCVCVCVCVYTEFWHETLDGAVR